MKKPFNNEGFHALQAELYQLPDSQLLVRVQAMQTDFKFFMRENFELDEEQSTFLDIIDEQMISFLALTTSNAVANRLEINLIKEEPDARLAVGDDRKRKIIRSEPNTTASASSTGSYEATGWVDIFITYEDI